MSLFETIKYRLVKKTGKIEIRQYDKILLASTITTQNSQQDAGFMYVFDYISGQNDQKAKISMTTPVVTYVEDKKLVTGFYVPSKYDKNTIPRPIEKQVFINELQKSKYAVIRFRGTWKLSNIEKHDAILKTYLKENNIIIKSQRLFLRYQPPFVPGVFRRNEIAYQIE